MSRGDLGGIRVSAPRGSTAAREHPVIRIEPSELTQNETRTTVTDDGSAPQRAGAVSATDTAPPDTAPPDTAPPGAASSSDICLARSATPGPVPSSSTPTRSGRCDPPGQSSSTADGTSFEPAAAATAATAPARSAGPNSAVTHATAAGRGCSRKVASVIRPSVPRDPANSLPRSYPATFLTTLPPECATTPSARTTVRPISRSRGEP